VLVRNRSVPDIRDANHVAHVTAATTDEIDRLLARVEQEFAGIPHRMFNLDPDTPPPLEARLVLDGYERRDQLIMVLDGMLVGVPRSYDLEPIVDERGWAAYDALKQLDWMNLRQRLGLAPAGEVGRRIAQTNRWKSPPVHYWLAYLDGEPRGFCSAWEGLEGVGQVEDVFVHPDARHRGMATALIHACVRDCRQRGADAVIIVPDATDTPKQMYAALGFRPIALKREYWRAV